MATEPSVFAELQDAVAEVMPTLQEQGISVYLLSDARAARDINALSGEIAQASDEPLPRGLRANVHIRSTALYIYTSGTTGTEDTLRCPDLHRRCSGRCSSAPGRQGRCTPA